LKAVEPQGCAGSNPSPAASTCRGQPRRYALTDEYGDYPVTVDTVEPRRMVRRSSWISRLGTLLIVVGLGVLVWVLVVWQWNDPFTSLYTRWEQRGLDRELTALVKDEAARPPVVRPSADPKEAAAAVRAEARRFRTSAGEGAAIGRIVVPRLGLDMVFVNGTDSATLRKGPGRHRTTFMPGEGRLVYIAGHRTTYLAPFAHIDRLEPGDQITLEMPYATVTYAVTRHRVVDDQDLSVLASRGREEVALQACHPRFLATQRYIVWGRPVEVIPRGSKARRL
jgi:sortase A